MKYFLNFLVILVFIDTLNATLSKSDGKKKKSKDKTKIPVEDRQSNAQFIIDNHSRYSKSLSALKNFDNTVLGYVTPWNNHGYNVAKLFTKKFDIVSPVWLQIKKKSGSNFEMTGGHDIDENWLKYLKQQNPSLKIYPRILFDGWTGNDFHTVFTNEYVANACSSTIVDFLKKHDFDGAVLKIWVQLGGQLRPQIIHFVEHLKSDLHSAGMSLVFVIPPPSHRSSGSISQHDFDQLEAHVDFFSLMTYDYSAASGPGPNAPIDWIERCVEALTTDSEKRKKLLLGLNFYGMQFSQQGQGQPLLGTTFVDMLKTFKPTLHWEADNAEHRAQIQNHVIYYPTQKSISARLALAKRLGVGISIWEIGQGLDFFYDLL